MPVYHVMPFGGSVRGRLIKSERNLSAYALRYISHFPRIHNRTPPYPFIIEQVFGLSAPWPSADDAGMDRDRPMAAGAEDDGHHRTGTLCTFARRSPPPVGARQERGSVVVDVVVVERNTARATMAR